MGQGETGRVGQDVGEHLPLHRFVPTLLGLIAGDLHHACVDLDRQGLESGRECGPDGVAESLKRTGHLGGFAGQQLDVVGDAVEPEVADHEALAFGYAGDLIESDGLAEAARSYVYGHGRGGCPGVSDGDEVGRGPGEQALAASEHLGSDAETGTVWTVEHFRNLPYIYL